MQQVKWDSGRDFAFFAEIGLMLGVEHEQGELDDLYIPAAVIWMTIAAGRIWQLCAEEHQKEENAPGLIELHHGASLWKSGRGFTVHRWGFWKQRFHTLARRVEHSAELRNGCRQAHDAMLRAET
jgi:hypothetical protein